MSNEFLDYIEDILDAMDKAEILLVGVTYEQFEADFRINFAVVRALEIIGEAARRLPMDLRQQIPGYSVERHGRYARSDYPRLRYRRPGDCLGCCQERHSAAQTTNSADPGRLRGIGSPPILP